METVSIESIVLKVEVSGDIPKNLLSSVEDRVTKLYDELRKEIYLEVNKDKIAEIERNLLSLVKAPYVPVQNEYGSYWNGSWFLFDVKFGTIKIGWRKHVICITWDYYKTAEELFPEEKVTKVDRTIHAHSLDDAKKYLKKILNPEIIIDRSKWRCGGTNINRHGKGDTELENDQGYMCCLGFTLKQLGHEIRGSDPSDCGIVKGFSFKNIYHIENNDFSKEAININDSEKPKEEKETQLIELFNNEGLKLSFTGEYNEIRD